MCTGASRLGLSPDRSEAQHSSLYSLTVERSVYLTVHKPALVQLCPQISGEQTGRTAGTRTAIHREHNRNAWAARLNETQFDFASNTLKKQDVVWLITSPPGGALLLGMATLQ